MHFQWCFHSLDQEPLSLCFSYFAHPLKILFITIYFILNVRVCAVKMLVQQHQHDFAAGKMPPTLTNLLILERLRKGMNGRECGARKVYAERWREWCVW